MKEQEIAELKVAGGKTADVKYNGYHITGHGNGWAVSNNELTTWVDGFYTFGAAAAFIDGLCE